jgi:hypothetical protein
MLYKAMGISTGSTLKDLDHGKKEAVIAFATYSSLDRDGDRANQGMFTKSWQQHPGHVRYFKNHDKKQAPGIILKLWDDTDHAYAQVKHGEDSLGNDTFLQMELGSVKDASYGFDPVVAPKLPGGKGYNMKEVFHHEVSALTHWGAHAESGVQTVIKSFNPNRLKDLNTDEKEFLRRLIQNRQQGLMMAIDFNNTVQEGSDMWSYINEIIASQSYDVGWLKRRLEYGVKEVQELRTAIKAMEKYVQSSASDDSIQHVEIELRNTKQLLSEIDTAVTNEQQTSNAREQIVSKEDNEFLKQINYSLLKVNTL